MPDNWPPNWYDILEVKTICNLRGSNHPHTPLATSPLGQNLLPLTMELLEACEQANPAGLLPL